MKEAIISSTMFSCVFLLSLFLSSCESDDNDIPFEANDFTPKEGLEGTEITINGSDFGNSIQDVEVTLDELPATITEFSNTEIKVIVPKNTRGTEAEIRIKINSNTRTLNQKFLYPGPQIDDFSPKVGVLFKDIVVKGKYFSNNSYEIKVIIDNRAQTIVKSTTDSIVFQTNYLEFFLKQFPISVEIDGQVATSSDSYTFGMQYEFIEGFLSTPFIDRGATCPGSTILINMNDNRNINTTVISSIVQPTFTFNNIESLNQSSFPADNGGLDFNINIPTSLDIGTATISATFRDIELIAADSNTIEIEDGTFMLTSNNLRKVDEINIELSHFFKLPAEMIVKFKNTSDDTVITGDIKKHSYTTGFTTDIVVSPFLVAGTYEVSIFTPDGVYELKPIGDFQLVLTD